MFRWGCVFRIRFHREVGLYHFNLRAYESTFLLRCDHTSISLQPVGFAAAVLFYSILLLGMIIAFIIFMVEINCANVAINHVLCR